MPTVVTLGGLFAVADAPNACPTGWRLPKFDEWKGITDGGGDWNFHAGASVRQDVNGVNGFFMAKGVGDVLVANTTPTIESHVFVPFLNASAETPVADRVPTGYAASDNASYPGFRITPWDNGNDPWKFWVGADNEGVGATYGYRVRCVQEAPAPGVVEIAHGGKIWADRNLKAIGEWADNPGDVGGLFGEAIRPGNNPDFDAFCPAGWHLPSRAEYEAAVAGQTMFIFDGVETSVQQDVVNASTSTLRDAGGHELVLPLCTNATCGDTGGLYIGRSSGVAFDQGANADNSWLGWGYFTWWPWENHMSGNDNQNQGWKTLARCVKD
jgi:hypothetical protein